MSMRVLTTTPVEVIITTSKKRKSDMGIAEGGLL
jgi:hypothetical protein